MPRERRVWFPGAVYHIVCRGNHGMTIYRDEADCRVYLDIVGKTRRELPFTLHAYCLMNNHVHLLLQTHDNHISPIMQKINLKYVRFFNAAYQLTGRLFQGRFHARLITNTTSFLRVSRYIHRNPLKAGIVGHVADYEWSSFTSIANRVNDSLITSNPTLSLFENPRTAGFQLFMSVDDLSGFSRLDTDLEVDWEKITNDQDD